jgi:hypothetical protein
VKSNLKEFHEFTKLHTESFSFARTHRGATGLAQNAQSPMQEMEDPGRATKKSAKTIGDNQAGILRRLVDGNLLLSWLLSVACFTHRVCDSPKARSHEACPPSWRMTLRTLDHQFWMSRADAFFRLL